MQCCATSLRRPSFFAADTKLARIYFAAGPHPSRWNQFRSFGPTAARWDHHLPNAHGAAVEQDRAVYYCARDVDTCAAEVFQSTRRIDRTRDAPWLVVFALREAVTLLDLRGTFATKMGASTAIHSGPRSRARAWARELYDAYPDLQGLYYGSSMNGHAPAVALERTRTTGDARTATISSRAERRYVGRNSATNCVAPLLWAALRNPGTRLQTVLLLKTGTPAAVVRNYSTREPVRSILD